MNEKKIVHKTNESADKLRLETKIKRGTGTRNQDEIKVQVKGDNPADTVQKLNQTLNELRGTADDLRSIQPTEGEEE